MNTRTAISCSISLALAACSGSDEDGHVTWSQDVRPIVEERCLGCHVQGGIAPFSMETYADAAPWAERMAQQVEDRLMPPWLAGPGCNEYQHDPSLTDAEISTIADWAADGALEGEAGREPVPTRQDGLSRVDASLEMPEEYEAQLQPDDYRCFPIDWPETSEKFVTGFEVVPGTPTVVHHVVAFVLGPEAPVDAYDAADPGPGYTCFGGPGDTAGAALSTIGVWIPGAPPTIFPAGTGLRVAPGSRVVLQVHYNSLTAGVAPDRTRIDVQLADEVEKEGFAVPFTNPFWFADGAMRIPAGEEDVRYAFQLDPTPYLGGQSFLIHAATMHMHLLGTSASLRIVHQDGSEECVLDVPRWDFHWQFTYEFARPLLFEPGDQLSIECHWDNGPTNQPVVDGRALEPIDRDWGEGTTDEMCIAGFYVTAS